MREKGPREPGELVVSQFGVQGLHHEPEAQLVVGKEKEETGEVPGEPLLDIHQGILLVSVVVMYTRCTWNVI